MMGGEGMGGEFGMPTTQGPAGAAAEPSPFE
jgi:hypothetical protein